MTCSCSFAPHFAATSRACGRSSNCGSSNPTFTASTGPGQTWVAYRLAVPEIRRRTAWFVSYLLVSTLVYAEFKNVISRVAQVKELMGDRRWVVTTRTRLARDP